MKFLKESKKREVEERPDVDFRCNNCGYHTFLDLGNVSIGGCLFGKMSCKQCNTVFYLDQDYKIENKKDSKSDIIIGKKALFLTQDE